MNTINVQFIEQKTSIKVEKGTLLSKVCEEAGYAQDLVCGGNGKCGKCSVEIEESAARKTVLSCQYPVNEDIRVLKIHNLANKKVNVLTSNSNFSCDLNPSLEVLTLTAGDIKAAHCMSFGKVIHDKFKLTLAYPALKKLSYMIDMYEEKKKLTFIIYKGKIIDVKDEDSNAFALAIDIGSTTVAAYLYDMQTATLLNTYSSLNKQTAYGADVISRIGYCIKNENGTDVLRNKISETINTLIAEAQKDGYEPQDIYQVILCGNSTMQHLFFGLYPESLGKAPFVSTTHDFIEVSAKETLLQTNPEAIITFLPLLGGFVGADTTSVLIAIPDDKKVRLMIDLGTNGELACGTPDKYIVASTACGPALEGAGLSCGMRAAPGAIEHFAIDEEKNIHLKTILDESAQGICGSGIIDILAELLKNKIINQRGQMMSREKYEKKYGEDNLSRRLYNNGEQNVFLLVDKSESATGKNIYFAQKDARQIQLAKAAIATGCQILIENYGIKPEELHEICLAGAFGNYLDIENAQTIGLFPKIEGVNVVSIGNGAGTGVQMYLLDQSIEKKARLIRSNCIHTELNFQQDFKETYFDQMLFKNV